MQDDSFRFSIPSFTKKEAYDFEAVAENCAVFQELNAIAEEIEECRAQRI